MNNSPRLDNIENRGLYNAIINGGFEFWQRNTSDTYSSTAYLGCDRFLFGSNNSGGSITASRSSDVPNSDFKYSLSLLSNSLSGHTFASLEQRIEAQMVDWLFKSEGKCQLGFWFKSSKSGTVSYGLRNTASASPDPNFVQEVDVVANTWTKVYVDIPESPFTITNPNDNSIGWQAWVCLKANNISTLGWSQVEGTAVGAGTDLDFGGTDSINITGWFLVPSSEVEDFEPEFVRAGRNYADELRLCQRYFQKSYSIDTPVGTTGDAGMIGIGITDSTSFFADIGLNFKVTMRNIPVMETYTRNGIAGGCTRQANTTNYTGCSFEGISDSGVGRYNTGFASSASTLRAHYTADAEL